MSRSQKVLCVVYALIALAALLATWSQNLTYFGQANAGARWAPLVAFLVDTRANPASRSISVDLAFFLLAASAFMVIEARRLGVRFVWLYILFGFLIAISVTFPLFMIARERKLASSETARAPSASDYLGVALVGGAVIGLCWFLLS